MEKRDEVGSGEQGSRGVEGRHCRDHLEARASVLRYWPAALVVLCACGRGDTKDDLQSVTAALSVAPAVRLTLTVQTPRSLSPVVVAVGAAGSVNLGSGFNITAPAGSARNVTNVGSGGLFVDTDSTLGDAWSTSLVTLRDRVHVVGKVHAASVSQGNGVHIDGGIDSTTALTPVTTTSWTVNFPAVPAPDAQLAGGEFKSKPPGRYGFVQVPRDARLTLQSGTYYMESFALEAGGTLVLNQAGGPVLVYVRNTIALRGAYTTGGTAPPDLFIGYFGVNEMFVESVFSGTLVSSTAKLTMRSVTGGHTGSFFAPNIGADAHVQINFRPGGIIPALSPALDCVIRNGSAFRAVFGYVNTSRQVVRLTAGPDNSLTPASSGKPPSWFQPGTQHAAFTASAASGSISWRLEAGTATASATSTQCTTVTTPGGVVLQFPDGSSAPMPFDPAQVLANSVVDDESSGSPGFVTVGSTTGTFEVTANGAASYRIPIRVSPAVPAATPELALLYTSSGGDGPMGIGWSLGGLSRILRCPKVLSQDGQIAPVTFGQDGTFCLDGQKLVGIAADSSGRPTEMRTENDTFVRVLASYNDGAIGPSGFEVRLKDGRILNYGNTSDSRLQTNQSVWTASTTTTAAPTPTLTLVRYGWLLKTDQDRFGNNITLTYSNHSTQPSELEVLPDLISYKTAAGSATRGVSFAYLQTRNDPRVAWISGVPLATRHLLTQIAVTGPSPTTQLTLRSYRLAYDTPTITGHSLLTSVTECDNQGVCKAPTTLTYEPGTLAYRMFDGGQVFPTSGADPYAVIHPGDFNGDGWDDILLRTPPSGQSTPTWFLRTSNFESFDAAMPTSGATNGLTADGSYIDGHPIDLDADGRADLAIWRILQPAEVQAGGVLPDTAWVAFRSQGVVNVSAPPFNGPVGIFNAMDPPNPGGPQNVTRTRFFGPYLADLNGDGTPDALTPTTHFWSFLLGTPGVGLVGTPTFRVTDPPAVERSNNYAVNIDGVSKTAILVRDVDPNGPTARGTRFLALTLGADGALHSATTSLLAPDNSGERPCSPVDNSCEGTPATIATTFTYRFVDVTGDGLADAVRIDNRGGGMTVAVNSGGSFGPPLVLTIPSGQRPPDSFVNNALIDAGIRIFDYDEDGTQDLLLVGNTGDGLSTRANAVVVTHLGGTPQFTTLTDVPHGDNWNGRGWRTTQVLDVNGDGLDDIVTTDHGQLRVFVRQGKKADMLVKIVNGNGATTGVTYQPISKKVQDALELKVHTPATNCSYPQFCVARGLWVVSQHSVDSGTLDVTTFGNGNTFQHQYAGARSDMRGRGFLGFESTTTLQDTTGIQTVRHYANATTLQTVNGTAYPLVGQVDRQTVSVDLGSNPGGIVYTTTSNLHYDVLPRAGTVGLPRVYFAQVRDRDDLETEQSAPGAPTLTKRHLISRYFYDAANNRTEAKVTSSDGSIIDTFDDYQIDTTRWLMQEKTRHEVVNTVTGPNAETVSRKTTYVPDPATGLPQSQTTFGDDADTTIVTTFHRNPNGLPDNISTAPQSQPTNQRFVQIVYDAEQLYPVSVSDSIGHTALVAYHSGLGRLVGQSDDNGVTQAFQYDRMGRLRRASTTGQPDTTYSYQPAGNDIPNGRVVAKTITQRANHGAVTEYSDRLGRSRVVKAMTTAGGVVIASKRYDVNGRLTQVDLPRSDVPGGESFFTLFSYDKLGRPTSEQTPGGRHIGVSYQMLTTTSTDQNGHLSIVDEDELGRVVKSRDVNLLPGGGTADVATSYDYGAFDTLRHMVAPGDARSVTAMTYDRRGFRRTLADPNAGTSTFTYDGFGNLVALKDGKGTDSIYGFDPLGRPTTDVTGSASRIFDWDTSAHGIGKLARISVSSPDAVTVDLGYDTFSRSSEMAWNIDGQVFRVGRQYDADGRLGQIDYPSFSDRRLSAVMHYTTTGELGTVTDATGATEYWRARAYNAAGQVTEEVLGGSVLANRDYTNFDGRLSELRASSLDGLTKLRDVKLTYDDGGNVKTRQDILANTTETFVYDAINRLQTWQATNKPDVGYTYDDPGNLKSRTVGAQTPESFTYGERGFGPSLLTTGPLGPYQYDLAGNATDTPDRTYSHDDTGALRSVTSSSATVNFRYDGAGARTVKTGPRGTTITIGGLYERRTENGVTTHVVYIPAAGRVVGQLVWSDNGTTSAQIESDYFHTDQVGTMELVTGGDGLVKIRQRRDPFGRPIDPTTLQPLATPPPVGHVRLGFGGHEEDSEVGLVNMNARLYDPTLARFVSADPLVQAPFFGQSLNRYAFAFNNPLTMGDPTGLDVLEVCGGDTAILCDDLPGWEGADEGMIETPPGVPINFLPPAFPIATLGPAPGSLLGGVSSDNGDHSGGLGGDNNAPPFIFNPVAFCAGPPPGEVFNRALERTLNNAVDGYVATAVSVALAAALPVRVIAFLAAAGLLDQPAANAPSPELEDAGATVPSPSAVGTAATILIVVAPGLVSRAADIKRLPALQGPVVFYAPPGSSAEEIAQMETYCATCQEALNAGALSSEGRVATAGSLRNEATTAARVERERAASAGTPYKYVVGHAPDTTWTGNPTPFQWLDLSAKVNSSLGGQTNRYPVGYNPTRFVFGGTLKE